MKKKIILSCLSLLTVLVLFAQPAKEREWYELEVYYFRDSVQERAIDRYLEHAYLPAVQRAGLRKPGVFKAISNDTATNKRIYVLLPFQSLEQFTQLPSKLGSDAAYQSAGSDFLNAPYNKAPYARISTSLLKAFPDAPIAQVPKLKSTHNERVYELRSYESATDAILQNKIHMFNHGGEITLFARLGLNAVFYAEAITGNNTPNLVYMTSFENMAARDEHWKAFGESDEWKRLSTMPQYQRNVSRVEIHFLRATPYSGF